MKVLFLDIDGVLNSTRTVIAFGGFPMELTDRSFDQAAIGMLRRLCEVANVSVVLSSAWRITHHFADVGKAFGLPIIDRTPSGMGPRGAEIAQWLAAHPEVEVYAIVDDDSDMLDGQLSRFVHTNGREGLMYHDFAKLCGLFGVSPYDGGPRHREWMTSGHLDWSGAA